MECENLERVGKNLCTIYPKERFFSVLVVIGLKEKETVEVILQECTAELRDIYNQTKQAMDKMADD